MARTLAPGQHKWFYFTDKTCFIDKGLADRATDKEAHMQLRIFALGMFAIGLTACEVASTLTEGFKQARAVESALETATGVKPNVNFNWQNGQLTSVTVIFPVIPETKPLRELADEVRATVGKEFNQGANNVVLAFSLGKSVPSTKADARTMSRMASVTH
jgi:hypothetical protein